MALITPSEPPDPLEVVAEEEEEEEAPIARRLPQRLRRRGSFIALRPLTELKNFLFERKLL